MPVCCIVYVGSNGEKHSELLSCTKMCCSKWGESQGEKVAYKPRLRSGGAESDNACVCKWLI